MAKKLAPQPLKTPLVDLNGRLTTPWEKWFRDLFERAGGLEALSNVELEELLGGSLTALQATITALQAQANELSLSLGTGLDEGRHL